MAGCGTDSCRNACLNVALAIDGCRDEWGATWEDFGAESRAAFRTDCQETWDATRATLEVRQIADAETECQSALADLDAMNCADIRALYLY